MKFKLQNRNQIIYDQFICSLKKIVGLYIKKGKDMGMWDLTRQYSNPLKMLYIKWKP